MNELYALAGVCLIIAAFNLGKRRAFKKLKIDNKTSRRIDIDVYPDEQRIVIKAID